VEGLITLRHMGNSFYRKQQARLPLFIAVLLVGSFSIPAPAMERPQPAVSSESLLAFVMPVKPSSLPMPVRKPVEKPLVLRTSASISAPTTKVIEQAVRQGNSRTAVNLLASPSVGRSMSPLQYDQLRVKVATGLMQAGDVEQSANLAAQAMRRSGDDVPLAGWVLGLSAWQMKDYEAAFIGFASTAKNTKLDDWTRAGASFWAARAADASDRPYQARAFRVLAAQFDRTFYGQLASAQLGRNADLHWSMPVFNKTHLDLIAATDAGRLALDHVANGRLSAADAALVKLAGERDTNIKLAALAYATREGLPASALKLAQSVENATGLRYDAAYYPLGKWIDDQDYRVDRALVHAIIRQESRFDPMARSGRGATGLMQLMPSTANYIVKVRAGGANNMDLTRSVRNLDVGQHYVSYLLEDKTVNNDLLRMLIAYNAGPGNLAKWQKQNAHITDPLLFIEVIPSGETRAYVERVTAAYWIYRARLGLTNPTLAALSNGRDSAYSQPASWASRLQLSALWP
jgi:soluble lytic murein transglycosylase